MQLLEGTINNRRIFYTTITDDLSALQNADLKNWVLMVIEDDSKNPLLWEFANLCISKSMLYMMAVGEDCSKIDDLFDEAMVARELAEELPYWYVSDDDVLMTAWDENFAEGFWFTTSVASYEDHPIDTVLVVNMTPKDHLPFIKELIRKISHGWLPSSGLA